MGRWGTILKTTNGGTNWISQTSGTTIDLFSVNFLDQNTGWAVGEIGTILKTTNGGTNWTSQTSGTTNHLFSVNFVDQNTGWAVGEIAYWNNPQDNKWRNKLDITDKRYD